MSYTQALRKAILADYPRELCCARSFLIGLMLPTAECIAGATVFDLVGDEASSYAARLIDTVYHVSATFSNRRGGGGARRVCFSSKAAEKLLTEASHDGFETDKRFKCLLCAQYFFRGLFLSCGMMCDRPPNFVWSLHRNCEPTFSYTLSGGWEFSRLQRCGREERCSIFDPALLFWTCSVRCNCWMLCTRSRIHSSYGISKTRKHVPLTASSKISVPLLPHVPSS